MEGSESSLVPSTSRKKDRLSESITPVFNMLKQSIFQEAALAWQCLNSRSYGLAWVST